MHAIQFGYGSKNSMTEFPPFSGQCNCGDVRYQMAADPMIVHCCHCSWCQRETGSAFAVNALVELDQITVLSGTIEPRTLTSASGQGQRLHGCSNCGTTLWSHYAFGNIGEKVAFVRVGTLDQGHRIEPDIHIYTSSKQSWFALPSEAQTYPEYYRAKEVWSQSALSRRAALT
ncbi:MAG: hypothetical protein ACI9ON_000467 [Limisphaerales bacterium]